MSFATVSIFLFSILAQIAGISLIPKTEGFTKPLVTAACCALFVLGVGALARLSHRGVELGILIPIMAATIPLLTIVMGIVLYQESASPLKLSLLGAACMLIGVAAARA